MIEVTSVKFSNPPYNPDNVEMLGRCNVVFDNFIGIYGIEFCKSEKNGKYYLVYPRRLCKSKNLKSKICNPFTKETGDLIIKAVLEEFDKWICKK